MNCGETTSQSSLHQGGTGTGSIGYMPGLDGLRTLAVFAVIAYHLNLTWAPGGLLGVSLFFVLSGYLITNILLTQWERDRSLNLKDFWLRRARRLLPALFAMLAGVTAWVALLAPERLASLKQEVLAAVFYSSNWYLIFHDVSYFERFGPPSPLGHLWSLAVEEQFYLFWPLLLGLGLRFLARRKWVIGGSVLIALASAAAMALIYIPGHDPSRVYYGTDTRAFALLAGAVLAMVWPSRNLSAELSGKKRLLLDGAGSMGLLVVLLMMAKTSQYQTSLYQGGLLLFSIAAACLVAVLAHPASRLGKLFSRRPLRWLGECSYGIYLWHYPVIVLTSPTVNTKGPGLALSLFQIAVTILLATLSRYLIEEPIRYGRRKRGKQVPELPHRKRPLALGVKMSVSFLLILAVLFATAHEGPQISAKDLAVNGRLEAQEREASGEEEGEEIKAPPKNGEEQALPEEDTEAEAAQGTGTEEDEASGAGGQPADKASDGEAPAAGDQPSAADLAGKLRGDEITVIGDSLMINVTPVLEEFLPGVVVDAKIGRQMHQAAEVISGLQKKGELRKTVIVALGTNGAFTEKQLKTMLDSLEGAEEIVLVNTRVPRPWEASVNTALTKGLESYPDVKLIDWHTASSGHDDYFKSDGVHLNPTGAEAYGKILVEALVAIENGEQ